MTVTVDGITYTLSGSTATVTGTSAGPATTTIVTIPSTITISGTTYNVTSIGVNAFQNYTNLTSVTIGSNVTSIGDYAFANSTLLESITIPNSVTSIGNSTFTNCPKLATVKFMGDIPHIGSDNFWANTNDTAYYNTGAKNTVALYLSPPTPYYFTNVREITSAQPAPVISVTHSDQSTTINFTQGTTAGLNPVTRFEYSIDSGVNWVSAGTTTSPITATGLTNGTSYNFALRNFNGLYSGVSNIVPAVPGVPDAPTITGVTVSTGQAVIAFTAGADNGSPITGYQYSTDGGSNWTPTILTTSTSIITMTSTTTGSIKVTNLTNGTSYDFRLRAVNANGAGPYASTGLALVSDIIYTLSGSIATVIGANTDATTLTIPSTITISGTTYNVTSIGDNAFSDYTNLTSVTIGSNVTSIGTWVFQNCASLSSIVVDSTNTVFSSLNNVLFNKDKTILIVYPIGLSSTSYTIPSSVTIIAGAAFDSCSNLTSIIIQSGLLTISSGAFQYCSNLTTINIPSGLLTIGASAFFGCNLTSIFIPSSVTTIGDSDNYTFFGCPLTSIEVDPANTVYSSLDNVLFNKDKTILILYASGLSSSTYTVPNTVQIINTNAFQNPSSLTSITVPSSVITIADNAFSGCTNLAGVTFMGDIPTIQPNNFTENTSDTAYYYTGAQNISRLSPTPPIFANVLAITSAQPAPVITSVSISNQSGATINFTQSTTAGLNPVSIIDYSIDGGLNWVSAVTITSPITVTDFTIGTSYNFILRNFNGLYSTLSNNFSIFLTSIYGINYTLSGSNATVTGTTSGATTTTTVTIPSTIDYLGNTYNVTSISDYAFQNYTNLSSVTIPNGLLTIGGNAFYGCSSLTSVTLPTSVTGIGEYVFGGCYNIQTINNAPITVSWHSISISQQNNSTSFFNGFFSTFDIANTTIINTFYNSSQVNTNIIAHTDDDYGADFVLLNGNTFSFGGTTITSIPALDSQYGSQEWQLLNQGSLAYKNSVNDWIDLADSFIFTILLSSVPSAPTIDSVTVSSGQAIINFTAGENNGSPITGYQYSTDGGSNWTPTILTTSTSIITMTSATTGSITVTDLTNGTTYNFSIKAVNAVGAGSIWTSSGSTLVTDIAYTLSGSNATIFGTNAGPATTTTVTIPSTIAYLGSTYNVTSIHTHAFSNYNILTSVTIGSNVTSIGDYAFYNCPKLTIVTIPNSVTSIGNGAFRECSSLTSVTLPTNNNLFTNISDYAFYKCDSLARVTLPNSVTTIGNGAFRECSSLTSVTLPTNNNLFTNISDYAFYQCISLADVTIPNSVTTIGIAAFRECSSLANISIPSSVIRIDTQAFAYTTKLTEIFVDINNNYFSSLNGVLFDKLQTTLIKYPTWNSATSYTVPSTVTTISNRAFGVLNYSDNKLISVTLNNGLVTIADYTFRNCTFTSIIIPNSVTNIDYSAFTGCTNLETVTFMGDIPLIGTDNFTANTNDTAYYYSGAQNISRLSPTPPIFTNVVTIVPPPGEVPSPPGEVPDAPTITVVTVSSGQAIINFTAGADNGSDITGYQYSTDGGSNWTPTILTTSTSIINMTSATTGSITVTNLTNGTVYVFQIRAVNAVGPGASVSSGSTLVTDITYTLSGSDATITGTRAGAETTTTVTIPSTIAYLGSTYNVKSIRDIAFSDYTNLNSIIIPSGLTSIGTSAFRYCNKLESIFIPASVTSIGNGAFYQCNSLVSIVVDSENTVYSSLNNVLFNKEQTILIQYAIGLSSSSYTIPIGVQIIGNNAFNSCTRLVSVTLPISLQIIHTAGFYKCTSLASIFIPSSVTSIAFDAFFGSTSLASIVVDSENTVYSSLNNVLFNKEQTILIQYACGLSSSTYTIPDGVTSITLGAFGLSSNLRSIIIPNSVTNISDYVFLGCSKLTNITIPIGVPRIGYEAFAGCTSLASITIGSGVTNIGDNAFGGCTNLAALTFMGDIPTIESNNFTANTSDTAYYYTGAQNIIALEPTPPIFANVLAITSAQPAPVITSVSTSNQSATIYFTQETTADLNPVSTIEYSIDGGLDWVSAGTTTSPITVTSITTGTLYNFVLRNFNGLYSNISNIFPGVPDAPTITGVTVSTSQAVIYFTAGADNGSPIIGYQYSTDDGSTWTPTILIDSTSIITMTPKTSDSVTVTGSITVTNLTNGTPYDFQIIAVNGVGASTPSNTISTSTPEVPDAPTIDSVTVSTSQVEIAFTPGSDNGSPITGYEFRVNRGDWTSAWYTRAGTLSPITVMGLENDYYTLQVRAVNGVGPGASASTASTLVTGVTTPTITNVTIDLDYVNIYFTGSGNKIGYELTNNYGASGGNTTQTTSPLRISVSSFADRYNYEVKIREYNDTETSSYSNSYQFSYISAEIAPGPPTINSVTIFNNIATLNFTPGQNDGTPIKRYLYSIDGYFYYPVVEIISPIQISNLKYGNSYNFKIRAENTKTGAASETYGPVLVEFPPGYIPPPKIRSVTVDSLYVNVNFTGSGNKISYRVDTISNNYGGGFSGEFSGEFSGKVTPGMETIIPGSIIYTTQTTSPLQIPISAFTIGTPCYLNIREYNDTFTSDFSTKYRFTYDIPPGPPTINNVIFDQWNDSIYFTEGTNSGSPIRYYEYNINGSSVWYGASSKTNGVLDVPKFKKGLYFTLKIRAFNNIAGAASDPYGPVLAELPPGDIITPTITNVTVDNSFFNVYFTASGNTNNLINCSVWYTYNQGGGIEEMDIKEVWGPGEGLFFMRRDLFNTNSAPVTSPLQFDINNNPGGFIDGQTYNVDMQEYKPDGSKFSDEAYTYNFTYRVAPVASVPDAPKIDSVTVSSGQAEIAFTSGADNGSAITGYQYSTDGGSTWTPTILTTSTSIITMTSATSGSIKVTNLTNGTTYVFQIISVNGVGASVPSNSVSKLVRPTLSQLKAENANKETYIENGYGLLEMTNSNEFDAKHLASAGFTVPELIPHFTPDELIKTGNFGGKELKQAGLIKNGIQFNKIFHHNKNTNSIEQVDFYFLKSENVQTNNLFILLNGKLTTAQERSIST